VGSYKLLIKPSAVKEIEAIPNKKLRRRLVERIRAVAGNPRPVGCEKLSGYHAATGCVKALIGLSTRSPIKSDSFMWSR